MRGLTSKFMCTEKTDSHQYIYVSPINACPSLLIFCTNMFYTGRASLPGAGGQAAAFHVAMWTSLDSTIDRLERFLLHCRLLGLTLLKQRDTSSGVVTVDPICHIGDSLDSHPSLAELLLHQLLRNESSSDSTGLRTIILLLLASVHVHSSQLNIGKYMEFPFVGGRELLAVLGCYHA